jgi:hypothetical protein
MAYFTDDAIGLSRRTAKSAKPQQPACCLTFTLGAISGTELKRRLAAWGSSLAGPFATCAVSYGAETYDGITFE